MKLRTLLLCIVAAIALTLCASAADIVDSGTCGENGDNVTWTLDSDGVLTISGAGEMYPFGDGITVTISDWTYMTREFQWYERRADIVTIIIDNGVVNIGDGAFLCCEHLTSITIPDSVTSISDWAFAGCISLTSVAISDSVTYVGVSAFRGCANLKSVTIGNGVTAIDESTFYACENLTDVYYRGSATQWSELLGIYGENDELNNATIHYNTQDIGVGITLTDKNGETVDTNGQTGATQEDKQDAFLDGAKFKASFAAVDPDAVKSSELVTANVFLVFYDRDGLMVSLESKEIDLSDPFNLMFVLELRIPTGAKTLKFLILSDNFEPLRVARMIESSAA